MSISLRETISLLPFLIPIAMTFTKFQRIYFLENP